MYIVSYKEWKNMQHKAQVREKGAGYSLLEFENKYPGIAFDYRQRELREQKRRDEIMGIKDVTQRQKEIAKNIDLF